MARNNVLKPSVSANSQPKTTTNTMLQSTMNLNLSMVGNTAQPRTQPGLGANNQTSHNIAPSHYNINPGQSRPPGHMTSSGINYQANLGSGTMPGTFNGGRILCACFGMGMMHVVCM